MDRFENLYGKLPSDRLKFRVWCNECNLWLDPQHLTVDCSGNLISDSLCTNITTEQCTGRKDTLGDLFFDGDIGEFDNGDRFLVKCEPAWNEFYVDWIGEPKCEDQARDFYRISKARKIGNIHENAHFADDVQRKQ